MNRIGLYFGSFNPVHMGHLIIAESILGQQLLDKIWMVVSPLNPFKKKKDLLDHNSRLMLINKAVEGNEAIKGSNIEFDMPIPSYTIDTLRALALKHPSYEFSLIMGADNLEHLDKWKESTEIIDNYKVYIYPRLGYDTNKFDHKKSIIKVDAPIIELSSTSIRNKIKEGRSIRYLTRESVRNEILKEGWYKDLV